MKRIIKSIFYKFGFKFTKINPNPLLKDNYLEAIKQKIGVEPILFDVGANQGQSVKSFQAAYPTSQIHSFEPSKICFEVLRKNFPNSKNLKIINKAVGGEKGSLKFNEYAWSALNSLLKRSFTKSEIIDNYMVDVITIDDYCKENKIFQINVLKTDTEGYELEVLKGAERMMNENSIQFIYCEIFFYENYIDQSSFGDIYNYLLQKGYSFVRFYTFEYTDEGLANRTDALFVNRDFRSN
ncbi:FkbM family methyltransferase [Aequorivita sp. F47161]|uniref:FkbM family methyltransferase n=1 Tax=Aequorivita vitellina TaxID=2874475 RepID=A0A9X1UAR7_9FLAO|nr:FkbM family methyltransferase [Aequorivita vitellina]MCG2419886.1 FkbM family methyltransferase [Aequorivita vitellina]